MAPIRWAVSQWQMTEYECDDPPRKVTPLVTADLCGANGLSAGLYKLAPGDTSKNDIHEEEEIYYVVSGTGRLVMDGQSFAVEKGMVVYIPPRCWHQSTNLGSDELCYFWVFAPPPPGTPMYIAEGWARHEPRDRSLP